MKIDRTKNAGRNIIFGVLLTMYQSAVPFIMRTLMTYYIGVEYLGLSGLFTSVLQVLNLAELGVGSAMVFSMYKPIAEDDKYSICALLALYKKYYRVIGLVVLTIGVVLMPFVPHLIKGSVPADINVYILYRLNLGATVSSYWMFAYRTSILQAHQRQDIISRKRMVSETVKSVLQIIAIVMFHSYYGYMCLLLMGQIFNNIITARAAMKMFPQYNPEGQLDEADVKRINRRIRDLFTAKFGSVVGGSADTIVISAFLGLTTLAVYQNYYSILTVIMSLMTIVFTACKAGIGNSLVVETRQKNYNDFLLFTFIVSWISGFCVCCFLCLFQPFMELWMGKELMVEFPVVICLCIFFYFAEINQLLNLYKDALGMWHEDRLRPLATALSNLTMNLLMVRHWGLYGVILSTVLTTLFVGMPWLIKNLFTVIFDKADMKKYVFVLVKYTFLTICVAVVTCFCCSFINGGLVFTIAARLAVCCTLSNVLFLAVYFHDKKFKESLILFYNITGKRFGFINSIAKRL